MSSSKPFLASKPLAFMMLTTIGANTGSVRLPTLMRGLSCAAAGAMASDSKRPTAATRRKAFEIIDLSAGSPLPKPMLANGENPTTMSFAHKRKCLCSDCSF
jgi:hypothetical protein